MKNTQSKHKTLSQTQQQTDNQTVDSITEVHLLDAPRKSVSFKCNEKLWESFVSTIKAQGLSVCHILEPMIYGWLEGKVHLSHTIRPIRIENLVVERAVRRVRRYAVEVDGGSGGCWYCGGEAVGFFRYLPRGEVYPLCKRCSEELLSSGKWSVVENE